MLFGKTEDSTKSSNNKRKAVVNERRRGFGQFCGHHVLEGQKITWRLFFLFRLLFVFSIFCIKVCWFYFFFIFSKKLSKNFQKTGDFRIAVPKNLDERFLKRKARVLPGASVSAAVKMRVMSWLIGRRKIEIFL